MSDYQPQPDDGDLIFADEAAAMLHTPIKTLYNWCSATRKTGVQHGPPFMKIGKRLQFTKGEVRRYRHDNTFGHGNGDTAA